MLGSVLFAGFAQAAAPATSPPAAPSPQEEIIVTGEREPRRLRDTAASVSVFDGTQIDRIPSADSVESLLALIPNVQIGSGGEGVTIRGQDTTGVIRDLPAFLGGARPRTTLQIDGRPADYFELIFGVASLWDVDHVEVFRSPQTVTQGRNAIAGAIFVTTAEPSFDWQGRARLLAADGGRRQASSALSGPLGDRVAFRLSADWGRDRTASDIADSMVGADPDQSKQWMVRLKLLAEASPRWTLKSSLAHSHSRSPQVVTVREPYDEWRDDFATYGVWRARISSWTGTALFDPSPALNATTTLTAARARFRRFAPTGLGEARVAKRTLTAEQIVRWKQSDRLSLLGGLHLLSERIDQHIDVTRVGGIGDFDDVQSSRGLFAQAEWKALPRLSASAAVRWQRDRQDRRGAIVGPGAGDIDYRGRFGAWLPKFTLTWAATETLTVGALVQKAYNPGGSTLLFNGTVDTFDREILWDRELFARGTVGNGRLRWSANLFDQRFRDAQRPLNEEFVTPDGDVVTITSLSNAPRAFSRGFELELDYRPSAAVRLRAGAGLLRTRITRTPVDDDPILNRQFQRAPRFSASAAIDWHLSNRFTLSAQARRNSGYFSDDANTPYRQIEAGTIVDAKASYDFGPVQLSLYTRNLTDRFQLTYLYAKTILPQSGTAADPREVGLELAARF